ncbi:MAG: hypothetical protein JXB26_05890 [Candidatus Aminicenantes bacterium]|nr:hypothetical protein [Candidatus Aminicenantes bacterium]
MWVFNTVINKIFDIFFFPFRKLSPWFAMIFISLLTAALMLIVFRLTSNQKGIKRVKNLIKAHLLEIRLYKGNMSVSFKAQGKILLTNLKYISYTLKPLLIMIVPLVLILIQLNLWFGHHSLEPGAQTILKVHLRQKIDPFAADLKILPSPVFEVETHPLRISENNEIDWRIRADKEGHHNLNLMVDGRPISKSLIVGSNSLAKVSTSRTNNKFFDLLFNPGESPIPGDTPISSIEIQYPEKKFDLFGWKIGTFIGVPGWLWIYFVLSIIFAFAFKGLFKVDI